MNEQLKPFLAGFDLAGRRLPNGKLEAYGNTNTLLDDWPEEITLFGNRYTLEDIVTGNNGYESGRYA